MNNQLPLFHTTYESREISGVKTIKVRIIFILD